MLKRFTNDADTKFWKMSYEDYVKMSINTVENLLQAKGEILPTKCTVTIKPGYHPAMDEIPDEGSRKNLADLFTKYLTKNKSS